MYKKIYNLKNMILFLKTKLRTKILINDLGKLDKILLSLLILRIHFINEDNDFSKVFLKK